MTDKNVLKKDKLLHINNNYVFLNKTEKDPVRLCSFLLLAQAIHENIKPKSKILISLEGETRNKYLTKVAKFLQSHGHIIYEYDKHSSAPMILDEYAMKVNPLDYLLKLTINTEFKYLQVNIKDSKFDDLTPEKQSEIYEMYVNNHEFNFDWDVKPFIKLNFDKYVSELCSKNEILKPFANVKQRYKSLSLLTHKNLTSLVLMRNLLQNYANNFKTRKRSHGLKWVKVVSKLFRKSMIKRKISNIFHFGDSSKINVGLLLNNRFNFADSNTLALIYLDFYLEEYKRVKKDISDFKVMIPHSSTYAVKDLLKQYGVGWTYFDHSNYKSVLNDKNYVFAYTENNFIANPKYSPEFNNYYFFICLIWMLNSYANRNNLLSFKYNKLVESFGSIKTIKKRYKLDFEETKKITNFISTAIMKDKKNKSNLWFNFEAIDKWDHNKYFFIKLTTSKKHEVIFYYDFDSKKLCVDIIMCMVYRYKDNYSFLEQCSIAIKINWILHKFKKLLRKLRKTTKNNTENDE
ncbi:MAG5620 family putative phospho-sugar mutase [Mycoplasma zalophidermidis]|uniref:Uncharacterized protein n=1 Tax=Mycoplasma zalophidermidis TaxID=398174 RepID=A0ABS6DS04_9MOLU|nr:hypothetical protein [Mycoplasma zalophidermidis]MBU4689914.1 hypothetical protein [Mycoplasma zalophidermidis]MBU4693795.1 hypothetical protein [Mycoplasma zalophidermidis]MCR8966801.1 hypothetical protein [Mycoplasma zalophidermidis]